MCGRFAFFQEVEPLVDDLGAVDLTDPTLRARWNIPPTAPIHVVTESIDKSTGEVLRALRMARWGLLPPFAQELSFSARTFNARRESLAQKPSFRGSMGRYRALVPMDGYYEWVRGHRGRSQAAVFHLRRGRLPAADGRIGLLVARSWRARGSGRERGRRLPAHRHHHHPGGQR